MHYPGLETHPEHHIATKQMKGGFGGVISFEVRLLSLGGLGSGLGQWTKTVRPHVGLSYVKEDGRRR